VVADAIQQAQSLAGPHDRILISGSLFTVGEAKQYFAPAASVTAQPVRG
jgi:folylpolyglutamate synthase/dihydropteroate synthase